MALADLNVDSVNVSYQMRDKLGPDAQAESV